MGKIQAKQLYLVECAREACKMLFTKTLRSKQRYCCEECRLKHPRELALSNTPPRTCANPTCGEQFLTLISTKKYCSLTCKKVHEYDKYLSDLELHGKTCICGLLFMADGKRKYCSKLCAKKAKALRDKERRTRLNGVS